MSNLDTEAAFASVLEKHLSDIKTKISAEAKVLAGEQEPTLLHLARAVELFAPGDEIYSSPAAKKTFLDYIPPVTILSAILTFSFAALGLWAILGGSPETQKALSGQGFLDIAKIFAGAIVGSATTAAASSLRTEKVRTKSAS